MNTTQLQCFTTLANTLNYVRTAEELHMTQPAVSRQIQSLENELGAKLFQRTTRSVTLTQIGAQFLPDALSMLKTYYHSVDWISSFHTGMAHKLRIGYADPNASHLIAAFLKPLMAEQSNISPELSLDQTDANLHKLSSGDLDLIFGMKDAKFKSDSILFSPLHDEHFYCVARKDHPLVGICKKRHRNSVSSKDLFPYRQIINIPPYLMKNTFSRGHRILPVNDELDNIIVNNANESYCLVLSGAGYSLLPDHLLMNHPDLRFLDWTESPHASLGIYCSRDNLSDPDTTVFRVIENAKTYYRQHSRIPMPV